jgi:hypothetical protein
MTFSINAFIHRPKVRKGWAKADIVESILTSAAWLHRRGERRLCVHGSAVSGFSSTSINRIADSPVINLNSPPRIPGLMVPPLRSGGPMR